MSAVDAAIAVAANDPADIEDIITKIGGVGVLLKLAPDMLRIVQTAMASFPATRATDPATRATAAVAVARAVLTYSQQTEKRVAAFQYQNGLHVDGVVGDETWSKVQELLAARS